MRYRDAAHLDLSGLRTRSPALGRCCSGLGFAGLVVAWWLAATSLAAAWTVLGALVVCWLAAWYLAAGALWRGPLVAAIMLASLQVALLSQLVPGWEVAR